MAQQQEELASLDRKLGQRCEEERLLQESGEQRRRSLVEVLKQGEEEAQDLQRHIKVRGYIPVQKPMSVSKATLCLLFL